MTVISHCASVCHGRASVDGWKWLDFLEAIKGHSPLLLISRVADSNELFAIIIQGPIEVTGPAESTHDTTSFAFKLQGTDSHPYVGYMGSSSKMHIAGTQVGSHSNKPFRQAVIVMVSSTSMCAGEGHRDLRPLFARLPREVRPLQRQLGFRHPTGRPADRLTSSGQRRDHEALPGLHAGGRPARR